ncbi:lasso peptide biosynthesis PqqD family chaperone [Spirillospora sp. NPDC048911]|uniref:lasso peptide biosynthesis PqqD family chaperone n=1 Tax=Spirillospora sp. NPDC048911 TaxID=3364527 RepID=UPI0037112322
MTLRLRDGMSVAETEYGMALLDEKSGEYWTLNPTGLLVLRTLLDGGDLDGAARRITDEYAVDLDTAAGDVRALVGELHGAGLITEG